MRRRPLLLAGLGLALAACGALGRPAKGNGLQALAAQRGLTWGSALSLAALDQPELLTLIQHNVGAITPENALKWDATEPEPGRFSFSDADRQLAYAKRNQMTVRGHALVWHRQLPGWLESLEPTPLRQALERHVQHVASHTRGRVISWDVVNEPLDEQGHGLRRSLWLEKLGPDYIADALRWARQADPKARLLINDYGLEGDDPQTARKRVSLLTLIDQLQRDGVPLDGIGLQAHLVAPREDEPRFATLPAFLQQLRATPTARRATSTMPWPIRTPSSSRCSTATSCRLPAFWSAPSASSPIRRWHWYKPPSTTSRRSFTTATSASMW